MDESLAVILHASLLGRTDIVQHALSSLRSGGSRSASDVSALISKGRSQEDDVPSLHIAAANGHADVVRALLNAGADPCYTPKNAPQDSPQSKLVGFTPYEVARDSARQAFHVYFFEQIAIGDLKKIETLIDGGVPVELLDGSKSNDSTLHWACSFNNLDVASALCNHGMNVNIRNNLGQTPLHLACRNGNKDIVELLLRQGADPLQADNEGKLPKDMIVKNVPELLESLETIKPSSKLTGNNITNHTLDTSLELGINESGDEASDENDSELNEKPSLLLLWPPPQNQFQTIFGDSNNDTNSFLQFTTIHPIVISSNDTDHQISQLVTWSGLLETFHQIGFQTVFKRSAPGSHVRLAVNQQLCPGTHRYELTIHPNVIVVLASDNTGLFYSLQTLIQILHLHTEIHIFNDETNHPSNNNASNNNRGNSSSSSTGSFTRIDIPCLRISDWPDTLNRGVLWTFRHQLRTSTSLLRKAINLFSTLHINQLFLVIDTSPAPTNSTKAATGSVAVDETSYKTSNISPTERKYLSSSPSFYTLDELCRRSCIDIIPTVIITNLHENVVCEQLQNFSTAVLCLVLQVSVPEDMNDTATITFIKKYKSTCVDIFSSCLQSGCQSVLISCSQWVKANILPWSLALASGLVVQEIPLDVLCPPSLVSRSFLSQHHYLDSLATVTSQVLSESRNSIVFPAVTASDVVFPWLPLMVLLFGGLAWNRNTSLDMLHPEFASNEEDATTAADFSVLNEMLSFFLFNESDEYKEELVNTIISTFTGISSQGVNPPNESNSNLKPGNTVSSLSGSAAGGGNSAIVSSLVTSTAGAELTKAEGFLWAIFVGDPLVLGHLTPSRTQLNECLRHYRRIILSAGWKLKVKVRLNEDQQPGGSSSSVLEASGVTGGTIEETHFNLQSNEFFCVIHVLSVICRALILAYNRLEKDQIKSKQPVHLENIILLDLLKELQAGVRSDLANSFLEIIEFCASIWHRRYDFISFPSSSLSSSLDHASSSYSTKLYSGEALLILRKSYLKSREMRIPLTLLFQIISDELPINVNQTLSNLFQIDNE